MSLPLWTAAGPSTVLTVFIDDTQKTNPAQEGGGSAGVAVWQQESCYTSLTTSPVTIKQSLVSAQHRCLLSLASVASKVGFLFTEQQPRSGYAATSYSDWACCTPRRTRRMSPPPKSQ